MGNIKNEVTNVSGDMNNINFSLDDFKRVREGEFLYVDKSRLIEDMMTYDNQKAILFTRPRRFGKSLNLSMLRYFFDMTEDSRDLFKGLYIENSEVFEKHLNKYPILYLNFKDVNINSTKNVNDIIADVIYEEIDKLYKKYNIEELKKIKIQMDNGNINAVKVKSITRILSEHTGKNVMVLVDEYDSLLNKSYNKPHWQEVAAILREILGGLFKSNEYLHTGVLTGVSRIGKELGFSDMNNLIVYGMVNRFYYEYFGFTENELITLLSKANISLTEGFYKMYNGYKLGNSPNVFNTVSILKFLDNYNKTNEISLSPYWINSATNVILKDNISKMSATFRNKLLYLLDGGTIIEGVFEHIDFDELNKPANIFSLLIDVGYLCPIEKIGGNLFEIKIPNEEVLYGYQAMIDSIAGIDSDILSNLCMSLIDGDTELFEERFYDILLKVSSFNDFSERENSYHCLLQGALLFLLGKFKVKSNRESGHGRFDIALIPIERFSKLYRPIIIEFKVPKERRAKKAYPSDELLALANDAIEQILANQYYADYEGDYQKEDFIMIGIGAQGKICRVCKY